MRRSETAGAGAGGSAADDEAAYGAETARLLRPRLDLTVGLFVGLGGVVALVGIDFGARVTELVGVACVLLATVCYASATIVVKRYLDDLHPMGPVALALGLATVAGIGPSYVLNRRWVWRRRGAHDLRREVLPFWTMSLAAIDEMITASDSVPSANTTDTREASCTT